MGLAIVPSAAGSIIPKGSATVTIAVTSSTLGAARTAVVAPNEYPASTASAARTLFCVVRKRTAAIASAASPLPSTGFRRCARRRPPNRPDHDRRAHHLTAALGQRDGLRARVVSDDGRPPQGAVARAVRGNLDRDEHLFTKDIVAIDLRLPDRLVVQLSDDAAKAREEALKKKDPKKKVGDA